MSDLVADYIQREMAGVIKDVLHSQGDSGLGAGCYVTWTRSRSLVQKLDMDTRAWYTDIMSKLNTLYTVEELN